MKKFFLRFIALIALMLAVPATTHATDWFAVLSDGGETLAVNPDISPRGKASWERHEGKP